MYFIIYFDPLSPAYIPDVHITNQFRLQSRVQIL